MKRYQVLLFDADGTLLDFDRAEEIGIQTLLGHFGLDAGEENKEKYHALNKRYWQRLEAGELTRDQVLSQRFEEFFGGFGIRVDGKKVDDMYRVCLNSCSAQIDGAESLLKGLSGRYELYLITNGVAETQHRRLADSGLKGYFQGIFISEEAGFQKPRPEFFRYCFEKMGRDDVENMLVIGDSLTSDIRGGNGAGIDTLWYNPHKLKNDAGAHVDYEAASLEEIAKLLA